MNLSFLDCVVMSSSSTEEAKVDEIKEEIKTNDENRVPFIEDVSVALNSAKSQNKVFIVCCEQAESVSSPLWSNPTIIDAFAQHGIGLLIIENTLPFDQFTVLYPVIAFPTLYCINPQNGCVLQCKYGQDVNAEIVVKSIITSSALMQQQQQQNVISRNANNDDDNIQNAEEAPITKQKPALSKLEQIRQKAKAQKLRKTESSKSTSASPNPKPKPPTPILPKLNNYNFEKDDKLDAVKAMEMTRKDKLRKRKKKKMKLNPVTVSASNTASQRMNLSKQNDEDVYAETPIASAVRSPTHSPLRPLERKRVRMAFRINNEMDLEHYFDYDDKLMDVMTFIQNETGINDFLFISQYPPLHIDSVYMDRKMSQQMGLFSSNSDDDEKSNESKYDDIQKKLNQTLYELNLVPSCRVFIQPKFKGICCSCAHIFDCA